MCGAVCLNCLLKTLKKPNPQNFKKCITKKHLIVLILNKDVESCKCMIGLRGERSRRCCSG